MLHTVVVFNTFYILKTGRLAFRHYFFTDRAKIKQQIYHFNIPYCLCHRFLILKIPCKDLEVRTLAGPVAQYCMMKWMLILFSQLVFRAPHHERNMYSLCTLKLTHVLLSPLLNQPQP